MKKISAEIVADSINPQGDRITSYLLTFPRFVLAELNTHRVFSKNSASSRAIPLLKMVRMVEADPFIPIAWQKDHKGMQGNEYLTHIEANKEDWLKARDYAIEYAENLNNGGEGVTKQICNRLLEPFMWHTVLLTATEFENFFELRCPQYNLPDVNQENIFKSRKEVIQHFKDTMYFEKYWKEEASEIEWLQRNKSGAEVHMGALAEAMWDAMNESAPKELKEGEWHIPFGDKIQLAYTDYDSNGIITNEGINKKLKISTARCARLSYMTFDGEIDYEKDLKLHDTLLESQHMSPFEHCARAMTNEEYDEFYKGRLVNKEFTFAKGYAVNYLIGSGNEEDSGWCRNFKGFIQYRHLIEN